MELPVPTWAPATVPMYAEFPLPEEPMEIAPVYLLMTFVLIQAPKVKGEGPVIELEPASI